VSWGTVPWGGALWGQAYEIAATRLLYMTRMGPNFRALADILDKRWSRIIGVLEQIRVAYALDTATGAQVDTLGHLLGLPREGLDDTTYLRAIRARIEVLKSTAGTNPSMLAIWAAWTDGVPTEYQVTSPKHVRVGGTMPAFTRPELLVQALRAAVAGGTRVNVTGVPAGSGDILYFDCAASALASPGALDCASDPIAGSEIATGEYYP